VPVYGIRRSLSLVNSILLFTLSVTPAPRRVIRKTLPPCRKGKDPLLCTLLTKESTVELASCFCTPVYTVYAANCEHAPRRRPPRATLCPVNHFLYRSCVRPCGSGAGSYDLISYLISVFMCLCEYVKQTLKTLALLPFLDTPHF
jgi:hypothetical protein